MMSSVEILGFLLCSVVLTIDALKCLQCQDVTSLDQCAYASECPAHEECFMEKLVDPLNAVVYRGGCRSPNLCRTSSAAAVGRRAPLYTTLCSQCCNTEVCNHGLCGIPSMYPNITQCYFSTYVPGRFAVGSCQADEVCAVETYRNNGHDEHKSLCLNRKVCILITRLGLERLATCKQNPDQCGISGKRQSGNKICTTCCGDSYCNGGSCEEVMERLYLAQKNGVLDPNTLKTIGQSVPSTTPAAVALKCLQCRDVTSLDQCAYASECPVHEECFMEKLVDPLSAVVYRGGCRSSNVCRTSSAVAVGRRAPLYTTLCSQCCNTEVCNHGLCGIPSMHPMITQCYFSTFVPGRYAVGSCQADEICAVETYRNNGHDEHKSLCLNRKVCTLITRLGLERLATCKQSPDQCGISGKRQSGNKICSTCCGDSYCNGGSCEEVMERLYLAQKNGVLDPNTLKTIG